MSVPVLVRANAPLMSPVRVPAPLPVVIVTSPVRVMAFETVAALAKSSVVPSASVIAPAPTPPLPTPSVPALTVVVPA